MGWLLLGLWLIAGAADPGWCESPQHRIGVLAREGEDDTLERWSPTARYLASRIPGQTFEVIALRRDALTRAIARCDVQFVLTDPGHYVELAVGHGVGAVATLQHASRGELHSTAATAIVARAGRPDLMWMSDLKGKSFMAASPDAFAGFRLAWWELRAHDIDPFADFSRVVFAGSPGERIVEAVRDGTIDAAAVRTDVLERMVEDGRIDESGLRVLHPRATNGFPVLRSSDLYPEWPFAATSAPDPVVEAVAEALLAMPKGHAAARSGRYAGWTAPLDYHPVHEVLRDLHLPPYEDVGDMTLVQLARRHWAWLSAAGALLVAMAATLVYVSRLSYRLGVSKRALERARMAEAEMAHIGRLVAMGEMSTTLAHELNQPLAAIVNYANGSLRRLQADELNRDDLRKVLERIAAEGNRSAEIIRRLRAFMRKRKPTNAPENANALVRDAFELLRLAAHRRDVSIRLVLGRDLPPVVVDAVQIEQVIVNLAHNAIEAIDRAGSPEREVTITTRRNPRHGVDITVRDSGPGLPADVAARVFEPFVTTKPDGMGLGLSISRSIVEAHGGDLRAADGPNGGAVFCFTLPETELAS
jgi:two-component system sensor histidine kinase TtrS